MTPQERYVAYAAGALAGLLASGAPADPKYPFHQQAHAMAKLMLADEPKDMPIDPADSDG